MRIYFLLLLIMETDMDEQEQENYLVYDRANNEDPQYLLDALVWNCQNLHVEEPTNAFVEESQVLDDGPIYDYDDGAFYQGSIYDMPKYDDDYVEYDDPEMYCVCGMPIEECTSRCAKVYVQEDGDNAQIEFYETVDISAFPRILEQLQQQKR